MKSSPLAHFLATALAAAVLASTGRAQNEKPAAPTPAAPSTQPAATPVSAAPEFPTAQWIDIREYSYEQRATFFAGFKAVQAKVDAQITELNTKRAALDPATDTRDWDQAMKEMVIARAELKTAGEELRKAKPQAWNQQKDKVAQAWTRTQDAFSKVKLSTAAAN
jgi:hypothetical protein